jgi:DNA polymerase III alpha subunit
MWINHSQKQLIKGVLNHGVHILEYAETNQDLSQYVNALQEQFLDYPVPPVTVDTKQWFMPMEYQKFDIEQYCLDLCKTPEQTQRVEHELELYRKYDMIMHLKAMKYMVDTMRNNNVVWGVGRGSSVSSYCLFLIGVHRIDSIKYDLPLEEFFK